MQPYRSSNIFHNNTGLIKLLFTLLINFEYEEDEKLIKLMTNWMFPIVLYRNANKV